MVSLLSSGVLLRHNPRILKIPPYLSFLFILIGVAWLLVLPLNDYSRRTYISENALLPGQVHTYFAGSDQNVFRGYKKEVDALAEGQKDNVVYVKMEQCEALFPETERSLMANSVNDRLEGFFRASGLKVARQNFKYRSSGETYEGQNLYAILHAPRGDATEAIVILAAWRNVEGEFNRSGVALILTLARYFKRWSLWSKDIIFVVPPESRAGPQAWVDAYHDTHQTPDIQSLPLKSGALQGAVVVDYPFDHRFEKLHIVYDGVNGQLPNLDLMNTVVSIASGQMGIPCTLQKMWDHNDSYEHRLKTMLRGMLNQGLGHAVGPHSSFIPYHVDALTLQPFGDGWQDEMAMGRVIESTTRSLNNLLEHLHQSFFFYLLMQSNRFVSIGTYLPSAMLVAGSFTIMAIFLWIKSGSATSEATKKPLVFVKEGDSKALVPPEVTEVQERELFLPISVVGMSYVLGLVPLYIFNHLHHESLTHAFVVFSIVATLLPPTASALLVQTFRPTVQQYQLIRSFSLLLLGMFLSSLATLNFSLAFLIGLLAAPLAHLQPLPNLIYLKVPLSVLTAIFSPMAVLFGGCWYWGLSVGDVLQEAAYGWDVWGMYTQLVVWCVWWPAWLVGGILLWGSPRGNSNSI